MKKKLISILLAMMLLATMSVPAFAAETFLDVNNDLPWYEGIIYAYEHGITTGTGDNCFTPNRQITVREWAVMVCRALNLELEAKDGDAFGEAELSVGYSAGWLSLSGLLSPDTFMCRSALYKSAFQAFGVPVYSFTLYPDENEIALEDTFVRLAKEFGLCGDDAAATELITRGEAVQVIFLLQTQEHTVELPPIASIISVTNTEQVALNAYLLEANKIPAPILCEFQKRSWKYAIDFEYLRALSEERNMTCIGAADYARKTLYVSEPGATIHEFGHFLHSVIGFPDEVKQLYQKEAQAFVPIMREYSATDVHEYFADYFTYWIKYRAKDDKMALLQEKTPETYEYFFELESHDWIG